MKIEIEPPLFGFHRATQLIWEILVEACRLRWLEILQEQIFREISFAADRRMLIAWLLLYNHILRLQWLVAGMMLLFIVSILSAVNQGFEWVYKHIFNLH